MLKYDMIAGEERMARLWRIDYGGAYYHVLSRGNEGRDIFYDDKDRRGFLDALGEMSERFEIEIYAFVLMSNHYHFLLQTKGSNLSRAMQWFRVTYTAVSHIVREVKGKMKSHRDYRKKYALINSQIKL